MMAVDFSVWIDYFNGIDNKQTNTLHDALGIRPVAVGDLILAEVLQGFRDDKDYKTAKLLLEELIIYESAATSHDEDLLHPCSRQKAQYWIIACVTLDNPRNQYLTEFITCCIELSVVKCNSGTVALHITYPGTHKPMQCMTKKTSPHSMSLSAKSVIALSVILALSACSSSDDDDADNNTDQPVIEEIESVSVSLDAIQEIPAPTGVPEGATGTADVSVDENGMVSATLGVSNLSDVATMAHIHRGFAGSTGSVLIGLISEDGGSTWTIPDDARALTADEIGAFNRGELYFNVHTEANPAGEIRGQIDAGNATAFLVRLENVSTGETLNVASDGSTQAVPLSPGAYLVHREESDSPLLLPRDAANAGLEAVAEDGNTDSYSEAVPGAAVFNTPVGADAPGPIGPGGAYEFTIQGVDGDKFDFVTMFIPSNDWFYTIADDDNSLDLFVDGQPISGAVAQTDIAIYDAGTEADEEPGTGANQVQRQPAPDTGDADPDTRVGSLEARGQSVSLNGEVIRVTITPQ